MSDTISTMEQPEDDFVEIDLDAAGNVMPTKHDKRIIVDADTIAFASCIVCQYEVEALSSDFLSEEEMVELRKKPSWDEDNLSYVDINIQEALEHSKGKIKLILDRIGGKEENMFLHFTGGKLSFRYDLLKYHFPDDIKMHYKHKRVKKTAPAGLFELKELLAKEYQGTIWYNVEADDVVVMEKKKYGDNSILVAVDKDVIKNSVGTHWNYYDVPGVRGMRWETYTKDEALVNQYRQVLTGDTSDNVPGLHRVGPKTAEKILTVGMTKDELDDAILNMYRERCDYGDYALMCQLNMQLVNMHQIDEELNIKLWTFIEEPQMITAEQIEENIQNYKVKYTASVWQKLKANNKPLTKEEADLYYIIQKAHIEFTGYSLPPLPGAKQTKAQIRDQMLPDVKDEVIEKAVKGGLAAKLKAMRSK